MSQLEMSRGRKGDRMKNGERLMSQRKAANIDIICDMIRLQIRLRALLARLEAPPKQTVWPGASVIRNGN
jgi:hypothetical protein